MRPASAVSSFLVLTQSLLALISTLAFMPAARADDAERESQARFVDASLERLIEELGLSPNHELTHPGSTQLLCLQMCERFREGGLTPAVDCSARCPAEMPAPSDSDYYAEPTEPTEPTELDERAEARPDIDVSQNNSGAVVPATEPEHSLP